MDKRKALLFITRLVDKFGGNLEGEALEVIRKELEEAQKQSTSSTNTTKATIALLDEYIDKMLCDGKVASFTNFRMWLEEKVQQ